MRYEVFPSVNPKSEGNLAEGCTILRIKFVDLGMPRQFPLNSGAASAMEELQNLNWSSSTYIQIDSCNHT